jgi:HSP20 family molecular chaperone IbpA
MSAGDSRNRMWADACAMIERAEQMHRQFFQPGLVALQMVANWEPPVDVFETEREISVVVALPGVEPADIDVTIERGLLRVAGIRHVPDMLRGAAIHRLEVPYGRFERRIRLPAGALAMQRSELVNGCLFLSMTKRQ